MFTPDEIEAMPIELEKLYSDLEIRIMKDIVRRLKINSEITRSADWQINRMQQLGASKEFLKDYIAHELEVTENEINDVYDKAIKSGYARDKKLYKATGKDFVPYEENNELQTLVKAVKEQTLGEFKNITNSLGFVKIVNNKRVFSDISKYYQDTLDNAIVDIVSGSFDYNTVLKRVIDEMTASGLRTIDYDSGRTRRVDTAARSALMTGVNQVTAKITEQNAEKLDTEYFEVSWHSGARPSHQEWQGKVYSKEELISICGLGTATGLCGINCYHSYDPFIPGISIRSYTDEELEEFKKEENTPKKYKDEEYTKYEALQRQRKLETLMRKQKEDIQLLEEGKASSEDILIAKAKYRATSREYIEFSNAMDLPQQKDRVYVSNSKRIDGRKEYNIIEKHKEKVYNSSVGLEKQLSYSTDAGRRFIPNMTEITNLKEIAGGYSDVKFRSAEKYAKQYGGDKRDWKKIAGKIESDAYIFDIHWVENKDGVRYDWKIKNYSRKKVK